MPELLTLYAHPMRPQFKNSDGDAVPVMREFIVAKNPDAYSRLPYLLRLPVGDEVVCLKSKEAWPRTARVFCQQISAWPARTEIIERVAVILCKRRGPAIDLVLSRGLNRRSQFIFVPRNRQTLIFWQTPATATTARPGLRIPTQRAGAVPALVIDSRERYGYRFSNYKVATKRAALAVGDYAVMVDGNCLAAVERKSLSDFVASLSDGSIAFVAAELQSMSVAAIVVEGSYSALLRHKFSGPGFLADVLVRLQIRFPSVAIQFLESKKLAEDWTYRFLRCAYDNAKMLRLPAL